MPEMQMETYEKKTSRSRQLFERARNVMPAGVTYSNRYIEPYPFFVEHADGSKLYDENGNVFTDYWCVHFSAILGHRNPNVLNAIRAQAEKGWNFGLEHEVSIRHAEALCKYVRSAEMVRYTNSGTEANMYAVRLARCYTKRTKLGKFEGNWHGGYDALHYAVKPPFDKPPSGGLSQSVIDDLVVLPYNDLEGVRKRTKGHDLALIVVEPVMGASGMVPAEKEFLKGLRELCDETGALLAYDEVITGFRLGLGGGQEYFDVVPDLTVLGKIVGGGLPIGAVVGRRDIMERMDHTKYRGTDYCFHGGTGSANALTLAAGLATIDILAKEPVYEQIDLFGQKMRSGLQDIFERHDYPAQATGIGSMVGVHFTLQPSPIKDISGLANSDKQRARRFFSHQITNGNLFMIPENIHAAISYAHAEREIDQVLSVTEEFVRVDRSRP